MTARADLAGRRHLGVAALALLLLHAPPPSRRRGTVTATPAGCCAGAEGGCPPLRGGPAVAVSGHDAPEQPLPVVAGADAPDAASSRRPSSPMLHETLAMVCEDCHHGASCARQGAS
ncbi:uncharacterized protein [Miscanthus floridulus]|uniref:uncharacterized protein isoform X2 n=1 Tax=Miscanthus floridulus TaxID=154761 RepID=UPI00345B3BE5